MQGVPRPEVVEPLGHFQVTMKFRYAPTCDTTKSRQQQSGLVSYDLGTAGLSFLGIGNSHGEMRILHPFVLAEAGELRETSRRSPKMPPGGAMSISLEVIEDAAYFQYPQEYDKCEEEFDRLLDERGVRGPGRRETLHRQIAGSRGAISVVHRCACAYRQRVAEQRQDEACPRCIPEGILARRGGHPLRGTAA